MTSPTGWVVRGTADPVEVAAVLAVLSAREVQPAPSRYEAWRRARLVALREGRPTRR